MSTNERIRLAIEMARRGLNVQLTDEELSIATNEQLQELFGALPIASGDAGGVRTRAPAPGRMASTVRERIRGLSIGAAILQACSAEALDAAQIVEALEELRPGTNKASIYPDIKRRVDEGQLQRIGKSEPYKYRTVPSLR